MTEEIRPCPRPHGYPFEPCFLCWGSGEADPDVHGGTCPRCQGFSVEPHVIDHGDHWHFGYGGTADQPVWRRKA